MSSGWSWFIILGVTVNVVLILWHLLASSKQEVEQDEDDGTTGHEWDGITELNNPLPKWWFNFYLITVVFSVIYLILYPGMGNFPGLLGWSQENAYEKSLEISQMKFSKAFADYRSFDIQTLSQNKKAIETGRRLFSNYCSACHGSDGRGARGFPNLADNDWLYGSGESEIKLSIKEGRSGVMPSMTEAVGGENNVFDISAYLTKSKKYEGRVENGKRLFQESCVICHGESGEGNQLLGAPNLTDDIWVHGGSMLDVMRTINEGRHGQMPAHKHLLSDDEIHVLAAYVVWLREN